MKKPQWKYQYILQKLSNKEAEFVSSQTKRLGIKSEMVYLRTLIHLVDHREIYEKAKLYKSRKTAQKAKKGTQKKEKG